MSDHVRIFNQSCPPLTDLLAKLKRLPANKLGITGISDPADPRYAAVVWKRLFLITLERLGERHETLARVLAVHAVRALTSVSSATKYSASAELAEMSRLRYSRGQLKPKSGLHPDDMLCRYHEAKRVLASAPIQQRDVAALWRRWGGGKVPSELEGDLSRLRRAETRATHFLAKAFGYDVNSLTILLARARKQSPLTFPPR